MHTSYTAALTELLADYAHPKAMFGIRELTLNAEDHNAIVAAFCAQHPGPFDLLGHYERSLNRGEFTALVEVRDHCAAHIGILWVWMDAKSDILRCYTLKGHGRTVAGYN